MELSNNTPVKMDTKQKKTKKSTKVTKEITEDIIEEQKVEQHVEQHSEQPSEQEVINVVDQTDEQKLMNEVFPEDDSDKSLDSSDLEEKEQFLEQLDLIVDTLSTILDKNLKEITLTKDFITQLSTKLKKINKFNASLNTNVLDIYTKENLASIKNKDSKQKKPKKIVNKENMAINKGQETFPTVIQFMEISEDSLVSRAQLIQKINSFVRKEKEAKNPDIFVEGDNKLFKLIGPLKVLFEFIKSQMIERGDLQDSSEFPTQISYRDIMKYLKYCFQPTTKK